MTRIGLTQRVDVVEAYGERRDCLDQKWTVLLEGHGFDPFPLPNRIENVDDYLRTLSLDGLLLTSGNDLAHLEDATNPAPERDRFEEAALEYAIDEGLPVLGVCRGLEFLNVNFGGNLSPVEGHVAEDHGIEFDKSATAGSSFSFPTEEAVNSYHNFGIQPTDVADELTVVGRAEDGSIECVTHDEFPIWGIMWHPERDSPSAELDRHLLKELFKQDKQ